MTVEELLVYGKQHVHSDYAKIILSELLEKNILELNNYLDIEVEEKIINRYKKAVNDIKEGKPIQYALGNVNFMGNRFIVNENVLIPRFETEELVDYTIKYINKLFDKKINIIDLGCGSGVIGLSLASKLDKSDVTLVDISSKALEVTKENMNKLRLNAKLVESDMWSNVNGKFDVIISNPPYIKTDEVIEDIVKHNEPHLALYAGSDGLDCYRKILKDANKYMQDKCLIAFEIGYTQAEDIKKLAYEYLSDIEIEVKKDMSDRDRMVFIFKNLNK